MRRPPRLARLPRRLDIRHEIELIIWFLRFIAIYHAPACESEFFHRTQRFCTVGRNRGWKRYERSLWGSMPALLDPASLGLRPPGPQSPGPKFHWIKPDSTWYMLYHDHRTSVYYADCTCMHCDHSACRYVLFVFCFFDFSYTRSHIMHMASLRTTNNKPKPVMFKRALSKTLW